jgi:hypothetical protein
VTWSHVTWKEKVPMVIGVLEYDYAMRNGVPEAPAAGVENFADLQAKYLASAKWEKSNRMAIMIMKQSISISIRGAISDVKDGNEKNAFEFMSSIEENFKSSSKTYASTLITKMFTSHYDGQSGIREHIMSMCDMAAKLKTLEMSIFEGFLVHFITSCSVRPLS